MILVRYSSRDFSTISPPICAKIRRKICSKHPSRILSEVHPRILSETYSGITPVIFPETFSVVWGLFCECQQEISLEILPWFGFSSEFYIELFQKLFSNFLGKSSMAPPGSPCKFGWATKGLFLVLLQRFLQKYLLGLLQRYLQEFCQIFFPGLHRSTSWIYTKNTVEIFQGFAEGIS